MNTIERLQKLSGIKVTESTQTAVDRDSLLEAKARLKGIIAEGGRFTFKHTNAKAELAKVEEALAALDAPVVEETEIEAPVEVVEETVTEVEEIEAVVETTEEVAAEIVAEETVEEVVEAEVVEPVVAESVESVDDIVSRILEKDLTPQEVEVDYQNGPVENSGIKKVRATSVRLPATVKAAVNQRIRELEQAISKYDEKGYDDKSIKQQAIDCLKKILDNLSTNDLEGLKKAQIYFETLMSPLTDFFPPQIINWLAHAPNPYSGVNESYNRDFSADDDIGNKRLNNILAKLEDLLQFAKSDDEHTNNLITAWVQNNVGQAFWSSVADWLLENGFEKAAFAVREHSHESGY